MDAKAFRTLFMVLHNTGLAELEKAGVIIRGANGDKDWTRFNSDLTTFVLKLPEDRVAKARGASRSGDAVMCNACHNMCCGSDQFEGSGCDDSDEPDCWSDDEDDFDAFDDFDCACARSSPFECVQIKEPA